MRLFLLPLALVLALIAPERAHADSDSKNEPVAPRLDFFAGGHYAIGVSDACQRDSDVVTCSGHGFLGAHALVLLRPFEHLALGPSLAYSVTPSSSTAAGSGDYELELWRVSAEVRYWLSTRIRLGPYLALEAGYAFMSEDLTAPDAPMPPGKSSITQSGPLLGAGFGFGLALPFGLGVVPSIRGAASFFSSDPPSYSADIEAHELGTQLWVILCLDATFGFPL